MARNHTAHMGMACPAFAHPAAQQLPRLQGQVTGLRRPPALARRPAERGAGLLARQAAQQLLQRGQRVAPRRAARLGKTRRDAQVVGAIRGAKAPPQAHPDLRTGARQPARSPCGGCPPLYYTCSYNSGGCPPLL
jgi:hypothetical protein